jgi:Cupin domain
VSAAKASTTLIHRYSGVAIVVALISGFGTFTATRFVTASSAQPAPAAAKPLLVQALGDLPGREVRITLLDRAPGTSSTPHRHPGHHTFGYVIEGTYEFAIDGQPAQRTLADRSLCGCDGRWQRCRRAQ